MTVTLTSAYRFSAKDRALQCAEQTTMKFSSPFQFCTDFCRRASTFMTADELKYNFNVFFRNANVRTYCGRPLPFGRSVTQVELSFFSSRSTLVLV